jgi:hypothetical protein
MNYVKLILQAYWAFHSLYLKTSYLKIRIFLLRQQQLELLKFFPIDAAAQRPANARTWDAKQQHTRSPCLKGYT